uniref:Uncharacterized protein n=1 Tax=Alexandrium monilatum TaxID=311494 RepID=A0A7S4QRU5_9DINO
MGGAERARAGAGVRSAGSDSAKSTAELLQRAPGLCPQRHELRPWIARQGHCDGCGRMVMKGERVMDCRQCNWYLCDTCLPRPREEGSPLWGMFSYVVDAAAQELSELAADIAAFVPAAATSCAAPAKAALFTEELEVEPRLGAGRASAKVARAAAAESAAPAQQPREVAASTPQQALPGAGAEAHAEVSPPTAAPPAAYPAAAPAAAAGMLARPMPDLMEFTEDLVDLTDAAAASSPPPALPRSAPPPPGQEDRPAAAPTLGAPRLATPPAPLAPLIPQVRSTPEAHGAAPA